MGVIGWLGGLEPGSGTDTGPREPVSVNAGYGDWLALWLVKGEPG
jgi:hypothetical protein